MSDDTPEGADWVTVAVVARAHGLRGAVVLKGLTRHPHELAEVGLSEVRLRRGTEVTPPRKVQSMTPFHEGLLLKLEGIADRSEAEKLRGWEIVIGENERWDLPEDTFYADDLVGLTVFSAADGSRLGRVLEIREAPASDYLVVEHPLRAGGELLIPFIPQFVGEVDVEGERIEVTLVDGMLEI